VVAHVTPSSDAIAGDYVTTFTATAPVATASADIRVTIETSLLWGAVGIGLIAVVLIGLWVIFRRFGRR
jgi:Predicted membrane protein